MGSLRWIFIVFLALGLNAVVVQAGPPIDFPFIDAHIHLNFDGKADPGSKIIYSKDEFLKQAKEAGITTFLAHWDNVVDGEPPFISGNLKIHYCAIVSPLDGKTNKKLEKAMRSGLKRGVYKCVKIYLGYVHKFANDPAYKPYYQMAREFKVPVVFHTGDTDDPKAGLKYADPLTVDDVATAYPDLTLVLAHMGNPWIHSAAEVAYKNPNVYIDTSGIMVGDVSRQDEKEVQKYLIEPVQWVDGYVSNTKKMMFGTDWPVIQIKAYREALARAIPLAEQKAFFHDNAAKIFGF